MGITCLKKWPHAYNVTASSRAASTWLGSHILSCDECCRSGSCHSRQASIHNAWCLLSLIIYLSFWLYLWQFSFFLFQSTCSSETNFLHLLIYWHKQGAGVTDKNIASCTRVHTHMQYEPECALTQVSLYSSIFFFWSHSTPCCLHLLISLRLSASWSWVIRLVGPHVSRHICQLSSEDLPLSHVNQLWAGTMKMSSFFPTTWTTALLQLYITAFALNFHHYQLTLAW